MCNAFFAISPLKSSGQTRECSAIRTLGVRGVVGTLSLGARESSGANDSLIVGCVGGVGLRLCAERSKNANASSATSEDECICDWRKRVKTGATVTDSATNGVRFAWYVTEVVVLVVERKSNNFF